MIIVFGVPQWSVIGPILIAFYINNLHQLVNAETDNCFKTGLDC